MSYIDFRPQQYPPINTNYSGGYNLPPQAGYGFPPQGGYGVADAHSQGFDNQMTTMALGEEGGGFDFGGPPAVTQSFGAGEGGGYDCGGGGNISSMSMSEEGGQFELPPNIGPGRGWNFDSPD